MRLVLCDDNRILCEALAVALKAWRHQVVAITGTAGDGLAAVDEHRPDVLILDLPRAGGAKVADVEATEGLRAAEAIRQHYPDTAVLVLSSLADRATWSSAIKIGVAGFLSKDHNVSEIAAALDVIAAGGVMSDPTVPSQVSVPPSSRGCASQLYLLTSREKEVLRRITAGQSTGQMADEMSISINTLRTYVKNVLSKLGAHNRLQAAAVASREDLLSELSAQRTLRSGTCHSPLFADGTPP